MIARIVLGVVGALGFGMYIYMMMFLMSLLIHGFDVKETLKDMWS